MRNTSRKHLGIVGLLLLSAAPAVADWPNVILIMADDIAYDNIGYSEDPRESKT